MKFPSVAFLCCISLCSILIAVLCESSTDGKCKSLVNSPFNICISAGYNFSFSLPEKLNKPEFEDVLASALKTTIQIWEKCADLNLVVTMECSSTFPKCGNGGKRVLPCKRVCGELLKKCLYTDFRGSSFMQKYMEKSDYSLCVLAFPMKNQATKSASSRQTSGQTTAYQVSTDTFIKCPMPEGRRGC